MVIGSLQRDNDIGKGFLYSLGSNGSWEVERTFESDGFMHSGFAFDISEDYLIMNNSDSDSNFFDIYSLSSNGVELIQTIEYGINLMKLNVRTTTGDVIKLTEDKLLICETFGGSIREYKLSQGEFEQIAEYPENPIDQITYKLFLHGVSFTANNGSVFVGCPGYISSGDILSGAVYVYDEIVLNNSNIAVDRPSSISLFPNPTYEELNFNTSTGCPDYNALGITNLSTGRTISIKSNSSTNQIVSSLIPGKYSISLKCSGNDKISNISFIKI